MLPTIMSRGPIDLWTRTPRSIAVFSASAPLHHSLSSADFITNIAESSFRHTQVGCVITTGGVCLNDEEKHQIGFSEMVRAATNARSRADAALWLPCTP